MPLKQKLFKTLKLLPLYSIVICLLVISSLPSGGGGLLMALVMVLILTVIVISGPLGLIYITDARPNVELSPYFIFLVCLSVLPIVLYGYWFKAKSSNDFPLHLALILWVINGCIIAFSTMIQSI